MPWCNIFIKPGKNLVFQNDSDDIFLAEVTRVCGGGGCYKSWSELGLNPLKTQHVPE